jgi:hypothetical protein
VGIRSINPHNESEAKIIVSATVNHQYMTIDVHRYLDTTGQSANHLSAVVVRAVVVQSDDDAELRARREDPRRRRRTRNKPTSIDEAYFLLIRMSMIWNKNNGLVLRKPLGHIVFCRRGRRNAVQAKANFAI